MNSCFPAFDRWTLNGPGFCERLVEVDIELRERHRDPRLLHAPPNGLVELGLSPSGIPRIVDPDPGLEEHRGVPEAGEDHRRLVLRRCPIELPAGSLEDFLDPLEIGSVGNADCRLQPIQRVPVGEVRDFVLNEL